MFLLRRKQIYYFRLRIPLDVSHHFPCSEIKKSLHTTRYKDAKSLGKLRAAELERIFTMIRSGVLTDDLITKIVNNFLDAKVALAERQRNQDRIFADDKLQRQVEHHNSFLNEVIESEEGFDKYNEMQEADRTKLKRVLGRKQGHTLPYIVKMADMYCKKHRLDLTKDSTDYIKLCNELLKSQIKAETIIHEHLNGNYDTDYDIELKQRKKSNTLKEAIDGYITRKTGKIGARSLTKYREKQAKIVECLEYETGQRDIKLSDIDYQLTVKIAERLKQYPHERNKKYKGKTLAQIYKLKDVRPASPGTVREEIQILSTFFQEALDKYCGLERNFAAKVTEDVLDADGKKESEYRDVFHPGDIQEIIRELTKRKEKGEFDDNPHLLFITLIGLYQGARANEICQLYIDDIQQVDGIWCISHNEDKPGKSIKNDNSKRLNPIHPTLLELGLLKFWEQQKARGYSRLWEGEKNHSCAYYAKADSHSHYYCKWFNVTLKKQLALSNPEKQTFHSTRHTHINWYYQNLNIYEHGQAVTALVGHLDDSDVDSIKSQGYDPENMSSKRYAKGLNISRQYETLKLLDYGVDLSLLKM